MSRSDWSKPRISAVMPTIDVMPMTTPSTVSAERILLVRTVSNAIDDDFAEAGRRGSPSRYSRLSASIGSRRAARIAGIQAEEQADQRGDADAERRPTRLRPPPESA